MNTISSSVQRVIGLDVHPDSFTAAILCGPTPAAAIVEKTFAHVPLPRLVSWAAKQARAGDLLVLEASGNSFHIARQLRAAGYETRVLESNQLGKLKEAHANNDKLSAVRIGKAFLAGTAKEVWVPDAKTQERRDLFHAHRKAVKRAVQARNRTLSFLSDQGVRLKKGSKLTAAGDAEELLRQSKAWTTGQWRIIEGLLLELRQADQARAHWRGIIAQEVLSDPLLLSLVRLCGVREVVAFGLGAIIGDIHRFAEPRKLVKYLGLNPAFDQSGAGKWEGGIGGHGRKDLRVLLIEAAQALLRSKDPAARWGKRLMARKGSLNLAVAALARKLTVAVWYLMMGRWSQLEEVDRRLSIKVCKIVGQLKPEAIAQLGCDAKALREKTKELLQHGRVYVLNPILNANSAGA